MDMDMDERHGPTEESRTEQMTEDSGRRAFLRRAGATGVALAGLGAGAVGTASAQGLHASQIREYRGWSQ